MSKPATKQQVAQVAAQIPAINVFDESLPRSIVAKVTGNVDGALTLGKGKYVGKMVQNEITPDATTTAWLTSDLVTTDLGFDTDDDCYIINYNDASGTDLAVNSIVNCVIIGVAPNGKYILSVSSPGSAASFRAIIMTSSRDGSNWRWIYTCQRCVNSGGGGYGTETPDGTNIAVFNRVEQMNGTSGMLGIGMDLADIPAGLHLLPFPVGLVIEVKFEDGQYWFSLPNSIGGTCS